MPQNPAPAPGVELVTFGCRLNGVESDEMRRLAEAAGHRRLAIVNTCAVTGEAVRQGRQAIRRLKREHPDRPVFVTGCAAEIDPDGFGAMAEVDRVIGNRVKADAASWPDLHRPCDEPPPALGAGPHPRHTRGFVEVQNGCDHRCTFCVIPFGRGASRSIPEEQVEKRARALVETGVREIVLTGVDITAYGADLPHRPTLGTLVHRLLRALPGLPRVRLSSLDCVEADPLLLRAIATEPRLMPHLHLSLQSGSDLILKRMRRRHGRADAIAFCATVRSRRPDIVLGADLITGFPTETERMFADSLSLAEACGLTHLHVFPYSPRPGTAAARMPQVPREVARDRAARLRAAGERAVRQHLDRQVGRRFAVLIERGGKGRTPDFSAVRLAEPHEAGTLAEVAVDGHDGAVLTGRTVAILRHA